MTPLCLALIEIAARTLADGEKRPLTDRIVQEYRDDAQAVVVAVLERLGGKKSEPGLFSFASSPAALLINSLVATPIMELMILARHALGVLERGGIVVERAWTAVAGALLAGLELAREVGLTIAQGDADGRGLASVRSGSGRRIGRATA